MLKNWQTHLNAGYSIGDIAIADEDTVWKPLSLSMVRHQLDLTGVVLEISLKINRLTVKNSGSEPRSVKWPVYMAQSALQCLEKWKVVYGNPRELWEESSEYWSYFVPSVNDGWVGKSRTLFCKARNITIPMKYLHVKNSGLVHWL